MRELTHTEAIDLVGRFEAEQAIPEQMRIRSVAASSTAAFVNDSRVPSPSGYHSVS